MIAAENRNLEMARLLLEHGASVSAHDNDEDTALDEAARAFDTEMVRLLLAANPDQKDKDQSLNQAAGDGPVILKAVEKSGAQQEQQGHNAPEPSWVTTVRLLLDSGANIEARNAEGDTPLLRAAAYGQTESLSAPSRKRGQDECQREAGHALDCYGVCLCGSHYERHL